MIVDSEGIGLAPFDRVMACSMKEGGSHAWRHDIFLDYDAERDSERPYQCASGFWPNVVKILPND